MDKDSVMYLLMDMRVNGILDRILEKDEEYQEIARKSVEYLDRLEAMNAAALVYTAFPDSSNTE